MQLVMKTKHPSGLMVVVELDEDGAFCASVPDLPGCVAGGDDLGETLRDIGWALEAVLGVLREDDRERYDELLLG